MKKLIISVIAATLILSSGTGCKSTNTATSIYTSEGILIKSVDVGMLTWANYVNAGHATQSQVDNIKQAYNTYYNTQMMAKAALEQYMVSGSTNSVDIVTANISVGTAENALLSLLNQFIINK